MARHLYRAQVVFQHVDSLVRDAITNTFHILQNGPELPSIEPIAEAIRDFYTVAPTGEAGAMFNFFGSTVASIGHQVRLYEYDEATGARYPYDGAAPQWIEPFDFVGRGGIDNGLVSEVAVAVTLRNRSAGAVPLAQRTGRVYIGGLDTGAQAMVANVPRPSGAIRSMLGNAAVQLVEDLHEILGEAGGLAVYSRPYAGRGANEEFRRNGTALPPLPARAGIARLVDEVSVDDAFDTQRRRGERATQRIVTPQL